MFYVLCFAFLYVLLFVCPFVCSFLHLSVHLCVYVNQAVLVNLVIVNKNDDDDDDDDDESLPVGSKKKAPLGDLGASPPDLQIIYLLH